MRRKGAARFFPFLAILVLAMPLRAQDASTRGAKLFTDKCSACHSIGGGDLAGPDLIRTTRLSPPELHAALVRMQDNVGPLPAAEMEAFVALLRNPQAKQLVAAAQAPAPVQEVERGNVEIGRALFYGDIRFTNGGAPCFGCHTVGGRGGNLAKDLTLAHTRMNRAAIVSATAQPAFPLMKAAYTKHAITEEESFDLAAFLKESGAAAKPGAQPKERVGVVHGAAAGAALVALAGIGLILRTRRAGVRSRLTGRRS